MTTPPTPSADAIVYIPGLGGQALDDAALRIAAAFNPNAKTAAAQFQLEAGQDVDYISTEHQNFKTRFRAIYRVDPGKARQKIADLYEFTYIDSLVKDHLTSNVLMKGLRLLLQLVINLPHLFGAFRGKKHKTNREKLQYIIALLFLALLVLYLVMLSLAVFDAVWQAPQLQALIAPLAAPAVPPAAGSKLTLSQVFVILIAAIEIFYPDVKKAFVEAAVRYTSVMEYLTGGARRSTLGGQLEGLIDYVATQGYRKIHLVAYSFGTVIALDSLFPAESAPAERMRTIHTLVTIGCPFDLIRVFWPNYFTYREAVPHVPQVWINVYSPIDVMASNFREDAACAEPDFSKAIPSKSSPDLRLIPNQNIVWNAGGPARTMPFLEMLTLTGLEAHRSYWEDTFEAGRTAFSPVVKALYQDDFPLA